jgi:hypothetical protein
MQSSRLASVWSSVLMVLGTLALAAVIAPAARAANEPTRAPTWSVEGKTLKENETREITIKNYTKEIVFESANGKLKITCETASVAKGAFLANQKEEAVIEWEPEFSKCSVSGNGEKCTKIKEPLKFNRVRTEFVLNDLEPEIGNKILVEFDPRKGEEFLELVFAGVGTNEGCKFANTTVKGLFIGLLWTDPKNEQKPVLREIELGENRNEESYLIKFPDEPTSVYLWSLTNLKWELFKPTELKFFSEGGKLTGTLLILLAKEGVSTKEKFSLLG